jgi:hypothetical protein
MKRLCLQFAILLLLAASAAAADYPTVAISDTVWPEGDGATEGYVTFTLSAPYAYDISTSTRLYTPPQLDQYWAHIRFDPSTCLIPAGETVCHTKLLIEGNDSYQSLTKDWGATSEYLIQGGPGGFLPTSGANFTITLTEDDPVPSVTLADATVTEPENGVYWVGLTFEASAPVTGSVAWHVIDETATHSLDYWEAFANPDFPDTSSPFQFRNRQQASIGFGISPDNLDEADESFLIELYNPSDLTLERTLVRVTIVDSDTAVPFISAQAGDVTEGDEGATNVTITFTASAPVTGSFAWVTDNGSANAEAGDYQAGSGTVHFTGGTTATLDIPVFGDLEDEIEEAFYLRLSDPVGLQFAGNNDTVQVWIHDDDTGDAPYLSFVPPDGLMLYAGQSATIEAFVSPEAEIGLTVPLQADGGAIEVSSSVFIPASGSGELTVAAMSPGNASITCSGSIHCDPFPVQVTAQEIGGVAPRMASTAGGTEVTIHGTGFSAGCHVAFGGAAATATTVNNLQVIRATAPPHAAGTVNVTVTCGASTVTSPQTVEYVTPRRRAVGR